MSLASRAQRAASAVRRSVDLMPVRGTADAPGSYERFVRFEEARRRRERIAAVVVAFVFAGAAVAVATRMLGTATEHMPADTMFVARDTTLTKDHPGSIVVDADGVTLDCAGYTVSGPDLERGISVDGHSGVTVENCLVTGFYHGIVVIDGSGNTVRGNVTYANDASGIVVQNRATGTRVIGNRSDDNGDWGFQLGVGTGNVYRNNEASGNLGGFVWAYGADDLLVGNIARGNDGVGFGVSFSANMTFRRNVARGNGGDGFDVADSGRIVLEENRSVRNLRGFMLSESDHVVLRSNLARSNRRAGGQGGAGFETAMSDDNLFEQNRATRNFRGFVLWMGADANTYVHNWACRNRVVDARADHTGTGNTWRSNDFCSASP